MKTVGAAVLAWLAGETGRVLVAGGIGGFVGWLQSERRQIRDGIMRIAGGAIAARYLWPAPMHILGTFTGPLEKSPENVAMAAFLAGALGMSFVKVLTAMITERTRKGGDDE